MVLRTLEMQGFKSFPDKTELNFGKGITAVVGPNGSGKSNISDAVRWVLGETSMKSLRGSKTEDVIFGGTSQRKPLGFAQVTLTLDNADGTLKDKGEIVTVSRRYYRSGESEYKIDGEQVRRKDIHELFMDTGLGADGYSMVGQGKIDSIISAKNEDRRELFEEAAGISRFRHKRRDAERRLDQAQENLVRLLDILGELESRVGPLKRQSEKAKQFLALSDEKKTLEIGVWLNKINRFTKDLREQAHKIEAAEASYEICKNEMIALDAQLEQVSDSITETNIKIEELRGTIAGYERQAMEQETELSVLAEKQSNHSATIERLQNEIASADSSGVDIEQQIAQRQQAIADSETALSAKKAELESTVASLETLRAADSENAKKSAELSRLVTELTLQLTDCKVKVSQAITSVEEIRSRQSAVDGLVAQCEEELADVARQRTEQDERIAGIQADIAAYENAMEGYRLKAQSKQAAAEKQRDTVESLSRQLEEKRSRARMLTELEKSMEGFSGAVKAVMKQKEAKALSGIHGTLSQLITVDNEYSLAVEVALGAAMQNIVVSSESDAKRAINFLKQQNNGRATFLPLTAIKPRTMEERDLEDNFGFIDIAANLVTCDAQYRDVIANLLGRVMIVEDLDCAIGISKRYKNRYKIVTLDGQVMNPGGSMTGGSRAKGAGILSRANMIEELQTEAGKLETQLTVAQQQYKQAVADANMAAADLQGADAELRKAEEALIHAESDGRIIDDKLQMLREQKRSLLSEKENADGRILLFTEAQQQAQKKSDEIQLKIDETELELSALSLDSEEVTAQREAIRQQNEAINLALVTYTKDIEAARHAIAELELRRGAQTYRAQTIAEEIALIEEQKKMLEASAEQIKAKAAAFQQQAADAGTMLQSLIDVRNQLEKSVNEMNAAEKEKAEDREKLSTELVRLEERRDNMQREYDNLINLLFEQYELTKAQAEELGIVIEDMTAAKHRLAEIKQTIKKLGSINVSAIEEYKEVAERYEFLKEQIGDIESARAELNNIIADLTASMSERFLEQFKKINEQFKLCFADFFGGGKGEILLENSDDCLESPIEIKIQPPGKAVQNISLFSGGEKSLAAMALLFSVLKVTPAPFCIYDEVEAALDDVNVERFAKYMRKMTDKTQFISITHRRGTMEEADILYGVTMQEKGVSKLLELQSAELAEQMGLE
ncbi:MAG: chromosome segregation protein SMC [Eubacterium sp.]|nr:chromosome segregation protein SMC [Eubacterium sp.]